MSFRTNFRFPRLSYVAASNRARFRRLALGSLRIANSKSQIANRSQDSPADICYLLFAICYLELPRGTAGRVSLRNRTIVAAVTATHPYSNRITHPGIDQGCPSERKYQTTWVRMMLTVQTVSGRVEVDRRNGSSH